MCLGEYNTKDVHCTSYTAKKIQLISKTRFYLKCSLMKESSEDQLESLFRTLMKRLCKMIKRDIDEIGVGS